MKHIVLKVLGLMVATALSSTPAAAQVPDSLTIIDYFPSQPELTISIDSLNALVVYPVPALEAGVEGRVFIRLVAEADGSASDVGVMKGLGYGLDEEAVRVVAKNARFRWPEDYPADLSKRVAFTLPITFELPDSRK